MAVSRSHFIFFTVFLFSLCAYQVKEVSAVVSTSPSFTDVTLAAGFNHVSTSVIREDTGGGVAWVDIDNDGYDDVYIPNPVFGASWLYHNIDDGHGNRVFVEIASLPGSDAHNSAYPSTGVSIGDYDGDGCDDIYVTNGISRKAPPFVGAQRNTLLRNNFCDDGSLTFTDTTVAAGLAAELSNSIVSSFGDIDNDGDLDLYVGNNMPDGDFAGAFGDFCDPNHFYLNNNGVFTEISMQTGVHDYGCALGVTMTDFDNDGDLDIFVVNDFNFPGRGVGDFTDRFYINTGVLDDGGLPVFVAEDNSKVATTKTSMGIAIGDYDNDGDLDYYTTAFTTETVQFKAGIADASILLTSKTNTGRFNTNNGDGTFSDQTWAANATVLGALMTSDLSTDPAYEHDPTVWFTRLNTGWGAVFFDADNDGDLDLYVANGSVSPGNLTYKTFQPNRFLLNLGKGLFEDVGIIPGPPQIHIHDDTLSGELSIFNTFTGHALAWPTKDKSECVYSSHVFEVTGRTIPCYDYSRGTAVADYDNDGDMDVFVVNVGSGPKLYRNDTDLDGTNNWLEVRLEGNANNFRGIGAKVRISSTSASGAVTQMREVHSGSSHGSTHAFPAHFGFPSGTVIGQVVVEWPVGAIQTITNVTPDQIITMTEPVSADRDGDELTDVYEVYVSGTDPDNADTDGDGVDDNVDVFPNDPTRSVVSADETVAPDNGMMGVLSLLAALGVLVLFRRRLKG